MADKTVVFVCQHGAFRSRMAAAFFNASAPPGWQAISAGLTPQSEVSVRLLPLLEGTGAEAAADLSPPRALDPAAADRLIAIDAPIEGAQTWQTDGTDENVRDDIRQRVAHLVREIATRQ